MALSLTNDYQCATVGGAGLPPNIAGQNFILSQPPKAAESKDPRHLQRVLRLAAYSRGSG